MRRAIRILIVIGIAAWLAQAVDWPLVISWVTNIVTVTSERAWAMWQTLVRLGLVPDAIDPSRIGL